MSEAGGLIQSLDGIGMDNERGAVELTLMAASVLGAAGKAIKDQDTLSGLCMRLLERKPMMAPMVNLVNGALMSIDDGQPLDGFCDAFSGHLEESGKAVSGTASSLLGDGDRVMTYSNSSTVIETLKIAASQGKALEVTISEARPVREGVIMAQKIRDLGIPVTLVADSALFQEMEEVNVVMVGADSLSHRYLVNKIGTRGLASQARLLGKELIAVAGSEKVLPSGIDNYGKVMRPPDEITAPIEGVLVHNYYFDRTPLHLVTRIVTEKGAMGPFEIGQEAGSKKVHPAVERFFSR